MIESKRTLLRPIAASDKKAVFSYRSDAETNKYQGFVPKNIDEVADFIARNPTEFNQADTWFQLVIIDRESDCLIGDIGIHFIDEYQVEIGCTLAKQFHAKGYATETLHAVIDHLFMQLNKHRVIGSIDPLNTSSIGLLERLGFRKEAHFKQSLLIDGEWVDDIVYAILKSEWK